MDSLSLLRESLPNAKLESAERDMGLDFKAAAQSLAALYRSSKQTVKHAHDAGYAACLQDILQFIQTGLSTSRTQDDAMGVARVMDWVEGQLDRYREGKDFDPRAESADEASTIVAQRSISPRREPEPRSPSQTPRRASTSSLAPEPLDTPAKRRHIDPSTRRRTRPSVFATPSLVETRPQKRPKRSAMERERSVTMENRVSDLMDFEEDGPRERKRTRTSRSGSINTPAP